MTTKEMAEQTKGRRFLRVPSASKKESIFVEVEIKDTRWQFGRTDVLVKPTRGSGKMWVSLESLQGEGVDHA